MRTPCSKGCFEKLIPILEEEQLVPHTSPWPACHKSANISLSCSCLLWLSSSTRDGCTALERGTVKRAMKRRKATCHQVTVSACAPTPPSDPKTLCACSQAALHSVPGNTQIRPVFDTKMGKQSLCFHFSGQRFLLVSAISWKKFLLLCCHPGL